MKKIVLLLFVVCASVMANAQVYVGGTVGFWDNDEPDRTYFILAPEIGYNLTEKWAVGTEVGYAHIKSGDAKTNTFFVAPYARYSYFKTGKLSLFLDGGLAYANSKPKGGDSVDGFEIGLKPGLALNLTDRFSLVAKFGFLGYRKDFIMADEGFSDGFGFGVTGNELSLGFYINF